MIFRYIFANEFEEKFFETIAIQKSELEPSGCLPVGRRLPVSAGSGQAGLHTISSTRATGSCTSPNRNVTPWGSVLYRGAIVDVGSQD